MEEQIKILLVLPFYYPHKGGSEKYAEELYTHVMGLHKNVQVDVLCYNSDKVKEYEEYKNFRVYRIPCFTLIKDRFLLPKPISLIVTLAKLKSNHYKFVNTHIRFFDTTWWVWMYAKLIGAKSIFTGHVASHPVHQSKLIEVVGLLIDATIVKFSLNFYDYLTFANEAAREFAIRNFGIKKQTFLVHIGVDTNFFSKENSPVERKIPNTNKVINQNDVLVTYIGRLLFTKGITYLYDAIKTLPAGTNNEIVRLVLAGTGELEQTLSQQIIKDGLQDKVFLTGNLEKNQVRDLLCITDIFVNPSHHNEGLPNTILEAGAVGCFVIATDNGGTKEVIVNRETGLLIPPMDTASLINSLTWAIESTNERTIMANSLRSKVQNNYDWKNSSEYFYSLIKNWRR